MVRAENPPDFSKWHPIGTAPHDADRLLLFKPDERRSGESMFIGYWSDKPGMVGWIPVYGTYTVRATLWMYPPGPP